MQGHRMQKCDYVSGISGIQKKVTGKWNPKSWTWGRTTQVTAQAGDWAAAERDWSSWQTRGRGASSASGMTQDNCILDCLKSSQGKHGFPQLGGSTCMHWGDNTGRQILKKHKGKSFPPWKWLMLWSKRGCGTSRDGLFKNLAGQEPEQLDLAPKLVLLWAVGWTGWAPEPSSSKVTEWQSEESRQISCTHT